MVPISKAKTETKNRGFQDQDQDQDSEVPRPRPRPRLRGSRSRPRQRLVKTGLETKTQVSRTRSLLVTARLKKSTLDPADLKFCCPISQIPFASNLVERAAASRFVHHCDEHGLLPDRQSAYRRYHSTETAVVIVYNDIVRSVDRK